MWPVHPERRSAAPGPRDWTHRASGLQGFGFIGLLIAGLQGFGLPGLRISHIATSGSDPTGLQATRAASWRTQ